MKNISEVKLIKSSKGDKQIQYLMSIHYTHPKGFVGRQLFYKIYEDDEFVGAIAGGSATLHLPNRNEFFGDKYYINGVINNIFFHLGEHKDKNLGTKVLKLFRLQIIKDWEDRYHDKVIGFETLVELPRNGAIYKADNWTLVGTTKGYTCKRIGGETQTEKWSGKRVWDTKNLKPKLVFCKLV
jgi:hypothetical protein